MEFVSIGGLLPGLSAEDVRNGISQLRNRRLAGVFHRLKYIETYGTGIRRIFASYSDCGAKPEIVTTPNSFRLTLPNMNNTFTASAPKINDQARAFLEYLAEHGGASEQDLQDLLGVKRTRAYTLAKQLVDAGMIRIEGRGAAKRYVSN